MYPLNMQNPDVGGFAVANDPEEHKRLSDAGYLPALVAAVAGVLPVSDGVLPVLPVLPAEPEKRKPGRPKKVIE